MNRACTQVEYFHDQHAAQLHPPRGNKRASTMAEEPSGSVFSTPADRLLLVALLLHCADLSNAVKPMSIVDK